MIRVLIPTTADDEHARAVACAAAAKQIDAIRWFGEDFPAQDTVTYHFGQSPQQHHRIEVGGKLVDEGSIDVVWLRRPSPPRLPALVHPDDRVTSATENMLLFRSQWYALAPRSVWINPYGAHLRAMSKLEQLRLAPQVGLHIPPTLVSNDPDALVDFIRANRPRETIYKSFYPARWQLGASRVAVLETSVISEQDLPSDGILRSTPGIFQQRVAKAFEVRSTFFGAAEVSLRIHSQQHARGIIDWRSIPIDAIPAETFALPADVRQACRRLMHELGIIFACFDFIVTPEGEYVFLEVNEMGQFLWKDYLVPQLCILEIFLEFLRRPSFDFSLDRRALQLNYRAVQESAAYRALCQQDAQRRAQHTALLSPYPYLERPR
jgi:hypothetical protein